MDHFQEVTTCYICARGCRIKEGETGFCGKYTVDRGHLTETAPDKYLVICCISIETMPMLHYYPKGKFLQITTTGCNFQCPGCVSTTLVKELDQNSCAMQHKTAEEIVEKAKQENCIGISFLMNDPLASYFTFLNVARKAKKENLLVGCSSNGYFSKKSAEQIAPYLDFINIGIKGFSDEAYGVCGAGSLQPVLESIRIFYSNNVHIEISSTYKKGDEEGLEKTASWLADLDCNIPLQVMRYIPLEGAVPEWEPSIRKAEGKCRQLRKLPYVYLFNSPGTDLLNTYCPHCGRLLVERDFYGPMGSKVRKVHLTSDASCPECGAMIPILGVAERDGYAEKPFEGGYPFTRALEMVQAILIASGVNRMKDVAAVWERILTGDEFDRLHHDFQSLSRYLLTIEKFAGYIEKETKARELISYMNEKVHEIKLKTNGLSNKPRVYYAMGKPLFCLMGERFENQMVTAAGGISVNKEIRGDGRPGLSITVEELNQLNPEFIFISSFLSNSIDDFYDECLKKGIKVDAVRSKRIFTHTYPGWDFGSPRWILGLMNIANILHPDLFQFEIFEEAEKMYRAFYGIGFQPELINLSFAKPACTWKWEPDLQVLPNENLGLSSN